MLTLLFVLIVVTIATYIYWIPFIDNFFYSVPNEPKYIHSYVPYFGFAFQILADPVDFIRSLYSKYGKTFVIRLAGKRWVYLYDEQTYLTKVLKSPDLSIDEFFVDFMVNGLDINRQCAANEGIQQATLKQYHQYLVGDELEILNKRVHDSLIESMKEDAKSLGNSQHKTVNLFDFFGELMLFAGTEGLFGHSFAMDQRNATPNFYKLFQDFDFAYGLGVLRVPFWSLFYRSAFQARAEFIKRFASIKLHKGESKLIHAREELCRSDEYKHLFGEYDINAMQASLLWAAVANTAPASCWTVVSLLLDREAFEAVKQELNEVLQSSSTPIYDREILAKLKILESSITESVRRILQSASTRQAMTETSIECLDSTVIGLRKGDMVLYPAFLKHFDANLFGPHPYGFQYDRFVKKSNQQKPPSVMLFGCGVHMCPGRYWAMNEIKMLVALIIQHMDIDFINITDEDKEDYRKRLPYDYSKFVSTGGPKKGYENKFEIKYSYKNLHTA